MANLKLANMYYDGLGTKKDAKLASEIYNDVFIDLLSREEYIKYLNDYSIEAEFAYKIALLFEKVKYLKRSCFFAKRLYEYAASKGHKEATIRFKKLK